MELIPNEVQRALRDSIERLLADHYGMAQRATYERQGPGWSRAIWAHFAQLGLLGLTIAPEHGGSGLGAAEVMVAAEALGHALVLEPWMATAVIGTAALRMAGSEAQQGRWLPRIAAGMVTIAWAHAPLAAQSVQSAQAMPGPSSDPSSGVESTATVNANANGWLLNGAKALVMHGDSVDRLLVTAKLLHGELALFLVDASSPGITREPITLQDGRRAALVRMENLPLPAQDRLGTADAAPVIEHLCDIALACVCAEAVGVLQEMLDLTVEYIKTRQQFGVAIGSFQALQHRAVDIWIQKELSKAALAAALKHFDAVDATPRQRSLAASSAKSRAADAALTVCKQALQLHGAIGFTDEYDLSLYFNRALVLAAWLGNGATHRRRHDALSQSMVTSGEPA